MTEKGSNGVNPWVVVFLLALVFRWGGQAVEAQNSWGSAAQGLAALVVLVVGIKLLVDDVQRWRKCRASVRETAE